MYQPLSDERVNELAQHWEHEYDREIEATLETRVVSGIEDIFDDTSRALFELLALRSDYFSLRKKVQELSNAFIDPFDYIMFPKNRDEAYRCACDICDLFGELGHKAVFGGVIKYVDFWGVPLVIDDKETITVMFDGSNLREVATSIAKNTGKQNG